MSESIFIIDDLGRVEAILERAVQGTPYQVVAFSDVPSAKRKLLDASPVLILTLTGFQNDAEGGFRFAREVADHGVLSEIPVLLISDSLSEDVIRKASESGAKSLIPWPVTIDSLKSRLKPFLKTAEPPPVEAPKAAPNPPPTGGLDEASVAAGSAEQKIRLAQQILAKILHNLKTSALLDVIDLEDVPRVVHEIARAVCGIKGGEARSPSLSPPAARSGAPKSGETKPTVASAPSDTFDLDKAFGLKKS